MNQVIYGDTDSIMIYSGLDDIEKSKAIAAKVIQEVGIDCTLPPIPPPPHPRIKSVFFSTSCIVEACE